MPVPVGLAHDLVDAVAVGPRRGDVLDAGAAVVKSQLLASRARRHASPSTASSRIRPPKLRHRPEPRVRGLCLSERASHDRALSRGIGDQDRGISGAARAVADAEGDAGFRPHRGEHLADRDPAPGAAVEPRPGGPFSRPRIAATWMAARSETWMWSRTQVPSGVG